MDVNAKTDCEVGKVKYLKWKNDVIAEINSDYSVVYKARELDYPLVTGTV